MSYQFSGNEYKKASTHQKEWGSQIISELDLKGDERILDLGCGDGALTALLAERVPRGSVLGIDFSQSMIDSARLNQKPNLQFQVKNINDLDYQSDFDLIFSNAALHWVIDHKTLLAGILRSLKKGGVLRANFAAEGNCGNFIKIIKQGMDLPQYRRYFFNFVWPWYMPDVSEYEALVRTFPFSDVRVWGGNADRYFPDEISITRWIDQPSLVPFNAVLQPPWRGIFRDWVVSRMLESTRQPDGTFFETFRRINILAKK